MSYVDLDDLKKKAVLFALGGGGQVYEMLYAQVMGLVRCSVTFGPQLWDLVARDLVGMDARRR